MPPSLLSEIPRVKASGFSSHAILDWALQEAKAIDKANCRLYEARKLNAIGPFKEKRPKYCTAADK